MATASCSKIVRLDIYDPANDNINAFQITGNNDATGVTAGTHNKATLNAAGMYAVYYGDNPFPTIAGINQRIRDAEFIVSTGGGESFQLGHDGTNWFGDSCWVNHPGVCGPAEQAAVQNATISASPLEIFEIDAADLPYAFDVTVSGILSTFWGGSGSTNFHVKRIGQP